jgi:hypothetical protein
MTGVVHSFLTFGIPPVGGCGGGGFKGLKKREEELVKTGREQMEGNRDRKFTGKLKLNQDILYKYKRTVLEIHNLRRGCYFCKFLLNVYQTFQKNHPANLKPTNFHLNRQKRHV